MTNFMIQTLVGLPTTCLVFLVLVLAFNKTLRVNNFFIYGGLLAMAQFITIQLFWLSEPGVSSIATFSKIPGILFSPVFVLYLYGVLQTILQTNESTTFHRQSVWTLFLLSLFTVGFYAPFWFIRNHVRYKSRNALIVIFAFCLTLSFYVHVYLYTESDAFSLGTWLTIDMLTIASGIASALNLRATLLKENAEIEIDPIMTFLFGIFYLQYQMNCIQWQAPGDTTSSDQHTRSV